ncbi:MAG: hypothetical protein NTZ30_03195, partial [Planctomycetota bacterium]|nr:hypothetical protein [Planctomycetota bacterium]
VTPLLRSLASFGLRHWTEGSPRSRTESSSLALRTNLSPWVALHLASLRRSYPQLHQAKPPSDGDSHPADSRSSQAHGPLPSGKRVGSREKKHINAEKIRVLTPFTFVLPIS